MKTLHVFICDVMIIPNDGIIEDGSWGNEDDVMIDEFPVLKRSCVIYICLLRQFCRLHYYVYVVNDR